MACRVFEECVSGTWYSLVGACPLESLYKKTDTWIRIPFLFLWCQGLEFGEKFVKPFFFGLAKSKNVKKKLWVMSSLQMLENLFQH